MKIRKITPQYARLVIGLILSLTLFPACQSRVVNRQQANQDFVAHFGKESFAEFKGWHLFIRSYDAGNPIVFVYDERVPKIRPCDLAFAVTVSEGRHSVISTKRVGLDDSCQVDEEFCKKLAIDFLRYNLNFLSVDTENNVSAKVVFYEGLPDLMRPASGKPIDEGSNWNSLGDGWFEREEIID